MSAPALPSAVTGADGSFRLLIPPGEHAICLGIDQRCDWVKSDQALHDAVLKVPD